MAIARQQPRPDIEGLRGVGILLVVPCHAGVTAGLGARVP